MSSPVKSVDEFLGLVRRSGLVEDSQLTAVAAPWVRHAGLPPEPLLDALVAAGMLTRWQIDQLLKGKYKGFNLGRYRLLKLLGSGGMSTVYLAEHVTLRSKAAVKVLPMKRVSQSSYLARFEQEARLAARLNHPNIIRTFDLDTAGSVHYIAMEYVEGVDLHAKVKREGPLSVRQAADLVRQTATGLQHAHDEGLVHRDVKPANLMLDTRGTIKILDLGLALAVTGLDDDCSLTREHDERVLGTADYLAPEQASDSHKADRRSDIYALGCTLSYLLVGSAPFASGTAAARMHAHLHKPPPNLLERRPDVPIAIADLYFRMLAKQPEARPQSAREVADALTAWLSSTDPQSVAPRPEGVRRPLPRRHVAVAPESPISQLGRSAAGSSSSSIFPGPPSSGVGGSGTQPGGPDGPPAMPPSRFEAVPPAGSTHSPAIDATAARPPRRRMNARARDLAGIPRGLWLVIGAGILLATALAVVVAIKNRG